MKKKHYLEPSMEEVRLDNIQLLTESEGDPESTAVFDFGGEGEEDDNPQ